MTQLRRPAYRYQVGGSLRANDPSYVFREADDTLYELLKEGQFCYVFNCRQMGKSSLGTQVMTRLVGEGVCCVRVDLTTIGTEGLAMPTWYRSLIDALHHDVAVVLEYMAPETAAQVDWPAWQAQYQALIEAQDIAPAHLFNRYMQEILLRPFPQQRFVICIDEIDNVLNLNFDSSDFFSLIRACFNRRADDGAYERLTFALFGVATPARLIQDPNKTPFNLGRGVVLTGFTFEEAGKLAAGLAGVVPDPAAVVREILAWTGGQPFLTQKLCDWVQRGITDLPALAAGEETAWVEQLVRSRLIANWRNEDEPQHFTTIYRAIVPNQNDISEPSGLARKRLVRSLQLYQEILQTGAIPADDSEDQTALCLSGLVVRQGGQLRSYNRIYEQVFNQDWIAEELQQFRPEYYLPAFNRWRASQGKDPNCLLQEQELLEALKWSADKRLSNEDYQFLAACQDAAKQRLEATLNETKRQTQRQIRIGLGILAVSIIGALVAGMIALERSNQANQATKQLEKATQATEQAKAETQQAKQAQTKAEHQTQKTQTLAKTAQTNLKKAQKGQQQAENNARNARQAVQVAQNNLVQIRQTLGQQVETAKQALRNTETKRAQAEDAANLAKVQQQEALIGTRLEREGSNALRHFEKQQLDALLIAMKAGQELKSIVSTRNLSDYPAVSPMFALHTILSHIWEQNRLDGHQEGVTYAAFSPNGNQIITASGDRKIRKWQADGTLIATHDNNMPGIISPNGKYIIAPLESYAPQVKRRDGSLVATLQGNTDLVQGAFFSPDSNLIVTVSRNSTRIWKIDGTLVSNLQAYEGYIKRVVFSPDSSLIIIVSRNSTRVWKADGTLVSNLQTHEGYTEYVTFSPDGKLIVTASGDNTAQVWETSGALVATLQGHQEVITYAAFSQDSKHIATTSRDHTARVWKVDGTLVSTLQGHKGKITHVTFSPDGRYLVTTSDDYTAKIWQIDGTLAGNLQHSNSVSHGTFSPDGNRIITASWDNTARIWQTNSPLSTTFQGSQNSGRPVAFSPSGSHIVTISDDGTVKVWLVDGTLVATLQKDQKAEYQRNENSTKGIQKVAFSSNSNHIVVVANDGTVRVWKVDGTLIATLQNHQPPFSYAALSPDGTYILTVYDDYRNAKPWHTNTIAQVWQLDGTLMATLQGHEGWLHHAAFSPDGSRIVTASRDETARVWQTDGTLISILQHQGSVVHATFSPNSKLIVTASVDNTAKLWQADGTLVAKLQHQNAVDYATFSPDGSQIITVSWDGTAKLWRTDGTLITTLQGHQDSLRHATFSPDGSRIVTVSEDGTARVWRADGILLSILRGHKDAVTRAAFSPDGKHIITASKDGTARVWPVESLDQLLARGCDWLHDYLLSHPQELAQLPVCQQQFGKRGQRMGADSPYVPIDRATALKQQAEAKKPPTP